MTTRAAAAIEAAKGDGLLALENKMRELDAAQAEAQKFGEAIDYLCTFADRGAFVVVVPEARWETFKRLCREAKQRPCPTCGEPPPSQGTHACRSGGAR